MTDASSPPPTMGVAAKLRLAAIVLLLLASALLGVTQGLEIVTRSTTSGQQATTTAQLVYGFAGAGALSSMLRRTRWTSRLIALWGVGVTVTSGLAPVVWGGAPIVVGVVSAAGAALSAALVWFGWRAHERSRERARAARTNAVAGSTTS